MPVKSKQRGGDWPFTDQGLRAGAKAQQQLQQLQDLSAQRQQLEQLRRKGLAGASKARQDLEKTYQDLEKTQRRLYRQYLDFWAATGGASKGDKGKEQWLIDWDLNRIRNTLYLPAYYTVNPLYVNSLRSAKDLLQRLQRQVRIYPVAPAPPIAGPPEEDEISVASGPNSRRAALGPGQMPLPTPLAPGVYNAPVVVRPRMPATKPAARARVAAVRPAVSVPVQFPGYVSLPVNPPSVPVMAPGGYPGEIVYGQLPPALLDESQQLQSGGGYDYYDEIFTTTSKNKKRNSKQKATRNK